MILLFVLIAGKNTSAGKMFRRESLKKILNLKLLFENVSANRLRLYCFFLFIFIYISLPFRYAAKYEYIPDEEIKYHLMPSGNPGAGSCPIMPDLDSAMMKVNLVTEYDEVDYGNKLNVMSGGAWEPRYCKYVHDVAVIVPYRGRENQLKSFLHHIHPFLQKQLISYRIFVVEQTYVKNFNRGKLMNIGYVEAMKIHKFHCFIFHDVDLLPLVEKNIYGCTLKPRHLSASINSWRYNLKYSTAFGGVTAMLQKHFIQINGFSNLYFGWGGEDDDLIERYLIDLSLLECKGGE